MAQKPKSEILKVFRDNTNAVLAGRASGWGPEDSQQVVLPLINSLTDSNGNPVNLSPEAADKIKTAMAITPDRILAVIRKETKAAGAELDTITTELVTRLLNVDSFRATLVKKNILGAASKGTKKEVTLSEALDDLK